MFGPAAKLTGAPNPLLSERDPVLAPEPHRKSIMEEENRMKMLFWKQCDEPKLHIDLTNMFVKGSANILYSDTNGS